eukprot:Clim_evm36s230 gene=Clim_evmTU36s230
MTSGYVDIFVTTNVSQMQAQKRFDLAMAIADLKARLELMTGVAPGQMRLQLFDSSDKLVTALTDDDASLGSTGIENGYRLHVIDENPASTLGEYDDVSRVKKYEMADEEYDQKSDSVRNWMRTNKLGKYSESPEAIEERKKKEDLQGFEEAQVMKLGDRCEVRVDGQMARRGTIRFVGKTHFKPGFWVGVEYDEPMGKNDGSKDGKMYFKCGKNYGAFVRPANVEVGDYPELGFDDEDEI